METSDIVKNIEQILETNKHLTSEQIIALKAAREKVKPIMTREEIIDLIKFIATLLMANDN